MEETSVNPLFNDLILKLIYKYLDFPNKKSFRLVCKAWIDAILAHWRINTKLVIKNSTNYFNTDFFNLYKIQENPLMNLKLQKIFFSYISTHLQQIKHNSILNFQNLIIQRFGNSLEGLEMEGCPYLQKGRQGKGLKMILLKDFPNLKYLRIRTHVEEIPYRVSNQVYPNSTANNLASLSLDVEEISEGTAKIIFNLVPNLKKLQLKGKSCEILQALNLPLAPSGQHIFLESLKINSGLDFQLLVQCPQWLMEYIEVANPPLKTLAVALPFGMGPANEGDPFPFQPFLYKPMWTCLEKTLTSLSLRLSTGYWSWCTIISECSLPNLTELCLRFTDGRERDAETLKFDFGMLRGTPQLKVLHLDIEWHVQGNESRIGTRLEENDLVWVNPDGVGLRHQPILLEHLKDFRFELYHKLTANSWRALAGFMPNLLKIQAILDKETFPLVFQLWPDLKHCSFSKKSANEEEELDEEIISAMQAERGQTTEITKGRSCNPFEWDQW